MIDFHIAGFEQPLDGNGAARIGALSLLLPVELPLSKSPPRSAGNPELGHKFGPVFFVAILKLSCSLAILLRSSRSRVKSRAISICTECGEPYLSTSAFNTLRA